MSNSSTSRNYRTTLHASYLGYGAQAIANNFAPLLFITFESTLGIDLQELATLISVLFGTQLIMDLLASRYAERIGYRISIPFATFMCAIGLAGLGILPNVTGDNPMLGLSIATVLYAIGGGLIEVLVSPIVQGTPTEHPDQSMSALHTSYSFAQVAVVLVTTIFFLVFGRNSWPVLACLWALVPLVSGLMFMRAPLPTTVAQEPVAASDGAVIPFYKRKAFYIFILVMMGGGASEMAMGQWASAFTESTLGLSKAMGDLVGPAAFALMMGVSRLFYTKFGDRINLRNFVLMSTALCVISFLLVGLLQIPVVALFAFMLGGWSVGIISPGIFTLAADDMPHGGMSMFGLFSAFNDMGNALGPAIVGVAAEALGNNLHNGFLIASIFPILVFAAFLSQSFVRNRARRNLALEHPTHSEIYVD
jgi:MFS family permease